MEGTLQYILLFLVIVPSFLFGYFFFRLHLIIPIVVRCLIAISPFKKKWILLDSKQWCSYLEKGDNATSTETVLILHGFSGSGVDFLKFATYLDPTTHIICLNLLNHGDAACLTRDVEMSDMLQYLHGFIETANLQQCRIHLVGFSMGGMIAINYASRYPERISSLVLINPGGLHKPGFDMPSDGIVFHKCNKDLVKWFDVMGSGTVRHPSSVVLTLLRHHKNNTCVREAYVLRGLLKSPVIDKSVLLKLAGVKVLYLQGDIDVVTPKEGLHCFLQHVTHAESCLIKTGSHFITYTHTSEICALIREWLQNQRTV